MQASGARVQLHPVPLMAVAVSPVGKVSVTVTAPLVGPVPTLLTLTAYVAPVCPCVKLPLCDFAIASFGVSAGLMVVGSLALSLLVLVSPPPETLAALVTEAAAFPATFTVKVM